MLAGLTVVKTWAIVPIPATPEIRRERWAERTTQQLEDIRAIIDRDNTAIDRENARRDRDKAVLFKNVRHTAIGTAAVAFTLLKTNTPSETCGKIVATTILPVMLFVAVEDCAPKLKKWAEEYYIKMSLSSLGLGAMIAYKITK